MEKHLTKADALLIQYFFTDKTIRNTLIDESNKEIYNRIDIEENGDIILGKTSCRWWNRFIGCEKIVSFNDFAIRVANVISGQKHNKNDETFMGLVEIIAKEGIRNEDYSTVIDQLLIAIKFGMDGPLRCKIKGMDDSSGDPINKNTSKIDLSRIEIHVDNNNDIDRSFRLNPYETLKVKIKKRYEAELM